MSRPGGPNASLRHELTQIIDAAQAAIDPAACLAPHLARLDLAKRYLVVGAGKASAKMALACEQALKSASGLVIVPDGYAVQTRRIKIAEASHPIPDERGLGATQRILDLCEQAAADEIIALLSGGASALLVQPARGVSLEDKRRMTALLLQSGASIAEFNTVRKHLSQVKGGRLAERAAAPLRTFALSDVPGDDPEIIGSGPTVPDRSTLADARAVLARFSIAAPPAVIAALSDPANETPKRDAGSPYDLIAGPSDAVAAAARAAEAYGYRALTFPYISGDASEIAREHAALARQWAEEGAKAAIISGGELSVLLGRARGEGGRCREYLLAVAAFAGDARWLAGAAWDTDGIDGKGEDAGAFLFPDTAPRAAAAGLNASDALAAHRSGEFFETVGDAISLGPTLTNAGDMRVLLVNP